MAGYISKELDLVDAISHTEFRNILLKRGIGTDTTGTPGERHRSGIPFEKKGVEELGYVSNLSNNFILLYEDEKSPIVAKTCGGTSWSSTAQSKVSKAQKIKGILNVFGVYDYTNDQVYTQGYKKEQENISLILSNELIINMMTVSNKFL